MDSIRLSFDVVNTSKHHNVSIELWIDKTKFYDVEISPGKHHVMHEFTAEDGEHIFRAVLKNKTNEHTTVDSQGNIIEDATVKFESFIVDDIDILQLFCQLGQYIHDGNGSEPTISVHEFFGEMGCNGHAQLSFASPVYLWLLENM